jgi:hypothetical protein
LQGKLWQGHPTSIIVRTPLVCPFPGIDISVYINQHSFGGGSVTTVTTDATGLAEFDELYILNQVASGYQLIFDADFRVSKRNLQLISMLSMHQRIAYRLPVTP